ncbi:hypothetical protein PM082_019703 [Marasmius tenuissimus]|nr:hypothetical protein PM082_019703 [Marasmius tenuissimus]
MGEHGHAFRLSRTRDSQLKISSTLIASRRLEERTHHRDGTGMVENRLKVVTCKLLSSRPTRSKKAPYPLRVLPPLPPMRHQCIIDPVQCVKLRLRRERNGDLRLFAMQILIAQPHLSRISKKYASDEQNQVSRPMNSYDPLDTNGLRGITSLASWAYVPHSLNT